MWMASRDNAISKRQTWPPTEREHWQRVIWLEKGEPQQRESEERESQAEEVVCRKKTLREDDYHLSHGTDRNQSEKKVIPDVAPSRPLWQPASCRLPQSRVEHASASALPTPPITPGRGSPLLSFFSSCPDPFLVDLGVFENSLEVTSFEKDSTGQRILRSSFSNALCAVMTAPQLPQTFCNAFLWCYDMFISSHELLYYIILFFRRSISSSAIDKVNNRDGNEAPQVGPMGLLTRCMMQNRVIVDEHWNALLERLFTFLRDVGEEIQVQFLEKLREQQVPKEENQMDSLLSHLISGVSNESQDDPCQHTKQHDKQSFMKVDPQDLALQITFITQVMTQAIDIEEYSMWNSKKKKEKCIKLGALVHWFNNLSSWVSSSVINHKGGNKDKAAIIIHWISVLQELHQLSNFEGMMPIYLALQLHPISNQLKSVWKHIPQEKSNYFSEASTLLSQHHNFRAYREHLAKLSSRGPLIPVHLVILKDLAVIEEIPTMVANEIEPKNGKLVNWCKLSTYSDILDSIHRFQSKVHPIEADPLFLQVILEGVHPLQEGKARRIEGLSLLQVLSLDASHSDRGSSTSTTPSRSISSSQGSCHLDSDHEKVKDKSPRKITASTMDLMASLLGQPSSSDSRSPRTPREPDSLESPKRISDDYLLRNPHLEDMASTSRDNNSQDDSSDGVKITQSCQLKIDVTMKKSNNDSYESNDTSPSATRLRRIQSVGVRLMDSGPKSLKTRSLFGISNKRRTDRGPDKHRKATTEDYHSEEKPIAPPDCLPANTVHKAEEQVNSASTNELDSLLLSHDHKIDHNQEPEHETIRPPAATKTYVPIVCLNTVPIKPTMPPLPLPTLPLQPTIHYQDNTKYGTQPIIQVEAQPMIPSSTLVDSSSTAADSVQDPLESPATPTGETRPKWLAQRKLSKAPPRPEDSPTTSPRKLADDTRTFSSLPYPVRRPSAMGAPTYPATPPPVRSPSMRARTATQRKAHLPSIMVGSPDHSTDLATSTSDISISSTETSCSNSSLSLSSLSCPHHSLRREATSTLSSSLPCYAPKPAPFLQQKLDKRVARQQAMKQSRELQQLQTKY